MTDFFGIQLSWRDVLDIALVTFVFFQIILLIKGTRAVSVLYGLLAVVLIYFAADSLGLYTLNWLLTEFLDAIFLVIIILFQSDIRTALSRVGAGGLWRRRDTKTEAFNQLIAAVISLAEKRIGALVVIEKNVPLGDMTERGVMLDARLTKDLLVTIFFPNTPLHDGAVLVKDSRIRAAGCILPLTVGLRERAGYGTRHRAAMGITEETDAVAVVVSEERGEVSVAIGGKLTTKLDEVRLKRVLEKTLEMQSR